MELDMKDNMIWVKSMVKELLFGKKKKYIKLISKNIINKILN
jgi:hypothetical protein